MPTYQGSDRFYREYEKLTNQQKALFWIAVRHLVHDLKQGSIRKGLRVKKVKSMDDVWEVTWAHDGRALFQYGPEKHPGDPHVVWLRIGGHEIFE